MRKRFCSRFVQVLVMLAWSLTAIGQDDGGFGGDDFGKGGFGAGMGWDGGPRLSDVDITRELEILRRPHGKTSLPTIPVPEEAMFSIGTERDRRLEELFAKKTTFDFDNASIVEVADWLRDETEANLFIDRAAMEEEDIDPMAGLITIFARDVSFRAGLEQSLAPVGLTATIDQGVVTITSATVAEETLTTRVYPVADLIRSPLSPHMDDSRSLINCITTVVEPDSWDDVGGPGSVELFKSSLTVSNTIQVHREIERLMTTLRQFPSDRQEQMSSANASSNRESLEEIEKAMGTLVDAEFQEQPLAGVVDSLVEAAAVPYFFDHSVLENEIEPDFCLVTSRLKELPLGDALSLLLRQHGLAWSVVDESLAIMTKEAADEELQIRIYDMKRLVEDDLTESKWADSESNELMDLITSATAPNSWDVVGGPGSVVFIPSRNVIVVHNTVKTLRELDAHFDMLEQARRSAGRASTIVSPSDIVRRVYVLTEKFRQRPQAAQALEVLHELLQGSDNELDGERYSASVLGDKLILAHRRDTQPILRELLKKLDVIEPAMDRN